MRSSVPAAVDETLWRSTLRLKKLLLVLAVHSIWTVLSIASHFFHQPRRKETEKFLKLQKCPKTDPQSINQSTDTAQVNLWTLWRSTLRLKKLLLFLAVHSIWAVLSIASHFFHQPQRKETEKFLKLQKCPKTGPQSINRLTPHRLTCLGDKRKRRDFLVRHFVLYMLYLVQQFRLSVQWKCLQSVVVKN